MKTIIRFLLSLFLTAGSLSSFAQVIDVTHCDSHVRSIITQYSSYLQTKKPVTLDAAIKSQSLFIKSKNEPVLVFDYDPYYYWFRFILKNPEERDRNFMLLMAPVGMYDGRLFQKANGKWDQVSQTGLKYEFNDRSYQFTHHVFPLKLPPKSLDTLYLCIDASNVYKSFGFALLQPKELKIFENNIYFVFGIIVGLLILFFVLNVSLFFALKEKLHLWYALYIALLFLVVMKNDQLDQQFLGLDSETAFRFTPYGAIGALAIAVLLHVVQGFLHDVLIHNKFLYRCSILLKVNVLSSAVIHSFVFVMVSDYRIQLVVFNWVKLSILLGVCIIIIDCLYCVRKGFKSALFIFSGSLVFMIGSVQRLFFLKTLSFLFPPTTFHVGIMLEVFVITIGFIYRYWSEKELQRQKEDEIQTQTMHDISEEIHDNIGQTLTVANINLKTIDFNNEKNLVNKVNDAKALISKAIIELRDLSRTLKNDSTVRADIVEMIKTECLYVEKAGVFEIKCTVVGNVFELENKKHAIIIRIIKEVLQNVIKHSRASHVDVLLKFKPDTLSINIHDDGIGFDPSLANLHSNGLKNIRKRCHLLNATCHFESEAGGGTEISIDIPV